MYFATVGNAQEFLSPLLIIAEINELVTIAVHADASLNGGGAKQACGVGLGGRRGVTGMERGVCGAHAGGVEAAKFFLPEREGVLVWFS